MTEVSVSTEALPWGELIEKTAVILDPIATTESYWRESTREDGRLLSQCRTTGIRRGILRKQVGSAVVQLGTTRVMAAVALQVGAQPVGRPQGDIQVTGTLPEMVQSFLQRVLYETFSLEQLTIANNMAFLLTVSVEILENGGNIRDASFLACVAALSDTKLPGVVLQEEKIWLDEEQEQRPLVQNILPIPLTLGVWQSHVIVDPTLQEELAVDALYTVVVNARDGSIVSMQGTGSVDVATLALATKMAQGRARELEPCFKL
jgi:exosome complex RNA-binding protein Rrp42 (RNase PH superfamily)